MKATRLSNAFGILLVAALCACSPKPPTLTVMPEVPQNIFPLLPSDTPIPSSTLSYSFYWQGVKIQNPANSLTLYTSDCNTPLDVSSFSIEVTTNSALSLEHNWIAMILTKNPDNSMSQQNLFVGTQTSTTFAGASSQMFQQDIPFSLPCGNYAVALAVNYNGVGGYLMEQLVIQAGVPTPTPTPISGTGFPIIKNPFYWKGFLIQNPANSLTLFNSDCSQPLVVNSFAVAVTTNAPVSFDHRWMAMIITKNPDNTVNQQNLVVGPQTSSTFYSASTQLFVQDVPFSLPCGTYVVALAVNIPDVQGGYLMEQLIIQPDVSSTTVTPTPTPMGLFFNPNINAYCRSGPDPIFNPGGLAMMGQL